MFYNDNNLKLSMTISIQGWGIPSFLAPMGYRLQFPSILTTNWCRWSLFSIALRCTTSSAGYNCQIIPLLINYIFKHSQTHFNTFQNTQSKIYFQIWKCVLECVFQNVLKHSELHVTKYIFRSINILSELCNLKCLNSLWNSPSEMHF